MRLLRLALQLAIVPSHAPHPPLTPAESLALGASADSATRQFLYTWRATWEATQYEHPMDRGRDQFRDGEDRLDALHCHWADARSEMRLRGHMIAGSMPAQRSCPRWYPSGEPAIDDERLNIDGGLSRDRRRPVARLRTQLRVFLDSVARLTPGDVHVTEQRVRFAIDAGDLAGAAAAVLDCRGDVVRCGLLQALVLYRAGAVANADSSFLAAARLMSDSARCAWDDVGMLLDPDGRRAYAATTCAQRSEFNARLWWLADPMWIEPGNERRAEHFARKELVAIIASLGDDGRQRFIPRKGGEATIETLVRYGWPSDMWWSGPKTDQEHSGWLLNRLADTAAPYVVHEYTRGRLHTLPRWFAIENPMNASAGAWQLNEPADDRNWWPAEHFARDAGGIEQLPVGQTAMLRRASLTRVVWAGDADSIARVCAADASCKATLLQSKRPDDVRSISSSIVRAGQPIHADGMLDSGRTLIGVELPGAPNRAAARTRFATTVPPPLSALHGDRALSDPLLFDPSAGAADAPNADEAVGRMYGSTTFASTRRIGVYWEAYGFRASDSVDVELQVTSLDGPGVFDRLFGIFGRGSSGRSVRVHWREVSPSRNAIQTTDGGVPFQMRSVVVELSKLAPGNYELQLSMTPAGGATQTSRRQLVLR